MHHYNYNPFGKDIKEIKAVDLLVLKDIYEGWYIDYKAKMINTKDIAKHISAFANQYGGWLFFGIKESKERAAGEYVGINRNEIKELSISIREAATAHSNPEVYYDEKIVFGPDDHLILIEENAILIIYIPMGSFPPYVHSSGRIYRRIADHSVPKAETDRFVLDQLWNKGKNHLERIEEHFLKIPKYETNKPVLYIHLITNIFLDKDRIMISFNDFKDIMSGEKIDGLRIPMNTFYSSRGGLIARQTKNNYPFGQVPTMRWWHSGDALLTIPLKTYTLSQLVDESSQLLYSNAFIDEIKRQNFEHIFVCNLSKITFILAALFNQFTNLLKRTNNDDKIFASIFLDNTFNLSPFIEDERFIKHISENGIPLVEDDSIKIPEIFSPSELIDLNYEIEVDDAEAAANIDVRMMLKIVPIIGLVFAAMGIMPDMMDIVKFSSIFNANRLFPEKE
jgi:hypothetical protein